MNRFSSALAALAVVSLTCGCTYVVPVSRGIDNAAPDGPSDGASQSADGRLVAFASDATNLVPNDTNGARDVFVRDLVAGTVTRVSVDGAGAEGNASSTAPAISRDGRFVVFESLADNLVAGDTNGLRDIFLHDRAEGTTERVSIASDGTEADDPVAELFGASYPQWAGSFDPHVSTDGRWVAFHSHAGTFSADAGDLGEPDVFLRDRTVGTTHQLTGASGWYVHTRLSADGTRAAWSTCNPLSFGTTECQVVAYDLEDGTETVVAEGRPSAISADGRYLVFDDGDVLVHDRDANATELVSQTPAQTGGNASSRTGFVSDDGRFVLFTSFASDLIDGDTNGNPDTFLRDRVRGVTTRVGEDMLLGQLSDGGTAQSLSGDGRYVVFQSTSDVFAAPRTSQTMLWTRRGPRPTIDATLGCVVPGQSSQVLFGGPYLTTDAIVQVASPGITLDDVEFFELGGETGFLTLVTVAEDATGPFEVHVVVPGMLHHLESVTRVTISSCAS